jgi:DNA polymerase IV
MSDHPTRCIAHFDLDAFFVSVECLKDPALKGKPLLVGGHSDRGVVAACSYEARAFGIHSAMPMKTAMKRCPQAIVVGGDRGSYGHYSRLVTQIIADSVPLFEKASIDEFYIDMTGMEKFFGASRYVAELRQRIIKETGLPISYGLAGNKLVAKIATNEAKPNGQLEVPPGKEKEFLAPLHVGKIPMIGEHTTETLKKMGIEWVHQLAAMPQAQLEERFGKFGTDLWERANGIHHSPVQPYYEQKSVSSENTFHTDTSDLPFLHKELVRLTERVGYELRDEEKLAGCVTVKLRYANFETQTRQCTIPYTCCDHIIIRHVKQLFTQLYRPGNPVRLLGVRVSHLVPGTYQMSLFDDPGDMMRLYKAIDELRHRYGSQSVTKAEILKARRQQDNI